VALLASEGGEAAGNPHVWLSLPNAMHQVEMIRAALTQADPAGTAVYQANTDRYLAELRALDQDYQAAVAAWRSRKFVAFHAAWAYLARDYGLEQVAVVETTPGREPSPAEMAAIIQTARAIGAQAIFAEPQFPSEIAETIAAESGAQVLFLDPLGQPPDYRYLDLMRYNLAQISRALK
jgi:zinc transport system substrate-binding protein